MAKRPLTGDDERRGMEKGKDGGKEGKRKKMEG